MCVVGLEPDATYNNVFNASMDAKLLQSHSNL